MIDKLKEFDVFENCSSSLLEEVKNSIIIKDEEPAVTILNHGDNTKSLYLIFEGTVLITQLSEDGKVVALELVKEGQCFGEIAIIDGAPRSASVVSLGNVKLGILSDTFVKNTLLNDNDFCRSLLNKFSNIVRRANQQIFSLITANARKRLMLQLVRLSHMKNKQPEIRVLEKGLSHTSIASFVGVSRETVSRLIGDLKSDKILSINSNGEIEFNVKVVSEELSSSLLNSL